MEPEYLTKTEVQLNSNLLRTKNNIDTVKSIRTMLIGSSDVLCLQQMSEKKLEFTSEFWIF